MAGTLALFCAHKRLRTACADCTPNLAPRTVLADETDMTLANPQKRPSRFK